jgi:hypothetical protein
MRRPRRSHRNDLGSVFATAVIVVLGGGVCSILYALGSPHASPWTHGIIITVAGLVLAALIGVRFPRVSTGLEFWNAMFQGRADRDLPIDYSPEPIRPQETGRPGQQQPITAEKLRDIKLMSSNTWVPTRGRKRPNAEDDDDDVLQ